MNTEELAEWLYENYYEYFIKDCLTYVPWVPWEKIHPNQQKNWLKFAKKLQENYLELFVMGGT